MNGMEYVRKINHLSLEDVAKEIGVSRQFVAMWEKGNKKIPKERLEQLVKRFGIPEKYFQKELTEIDKLDIEIIKANREIDERSFTYEEEIYNDKTRSTITIEREHIDYSQVEYLESLEAEKKEALTMEKFKKSLESTSKYGFNINEITCLHDYTQCMEDNIKLYNRFINIVNCDNIDNKVLHEIMRAIELLDEQLSDKNVIWGEENPMDISSVSDENSVVQEIFAALKKDSIEKYIKREKEIKFAKEIMKEFELTEEDLL